MKPSEVKREMMAFVDGGSFITCTQLTQFLGCKDGPTVKQNYLQGLDRVSNKFYFIPDVVDRLMERR